MTGKFLAIYGINNIGKSTQTRILVERLLRAGVRTEYVKYPIYDLDPTGKMLNEILRGKKKSAVQAMIDFFPETKVRKPGTRKCSTASEILFRSQPIERKTHHQRVTEEELQMWYSLNRYQFDPIIQKKLSSGITLVAEDYTGTGLAWGSAKKADLEWLESVNKFLLKPDIEILMDGERFTSGREEKHLHESNDRLIARAQIQFRNLAQKYGWHVVNANQAVEVVTAEIWQYVKPLLPSNRSSGENANLLGFK